MLSPIFTSQQKHTLCAWEVSLLVATSCFFGQEMRLHVNPDKMVSC